MPASTSRSDRIRCNDALRGDGNSLRDFQRHVEPDAAIMNRQLDPSAATTIAEYSMDVRSVSPPPCAGVCSQPPPVRPSSRCSWRPVEVTAAGTCERLRGLTLPDDATITEARSVSPNTTPFFAPRAFCRVFVTIAPTADSDIKAEVWLPVSGWNQKFQAVGNGDAAGVISYDAMVEAIRRGYATSFDRHRSRRQHHGVRARPPRQVRRLRLSRRSRDDGHGENHRRSVLRHGAGALVLERLLAGRPSRHHRSDPLPRRLRRDYRGGSGDRAHAAARGAAGVEQVRPPLRRQLHSAREISGDSPCGAERVRRARRRRTTA